MCEVSSFWMSLSSFCTLLVRFEDIMAILSWLLRSREVAADREFIGKRCLRMNKWCVVACSESEIVVKEKVND